MLHHTLLNDDIFTLHHGYFVRSGIGRFQNEYTPTRFAGIGFHDHTPMLFDKGFDCLGARLLPIESLTMDVLGEILVELVLAFGKVQVLRVVVF